MKNIITPVISAVIASLITIAAFLYFAGDKLNKQQADSDDFPAVTASYYDKDGQATAEAPFDFTLAAEKAAPAVVHITSTQEAQASNREQQQQIPEFFRDFFGDQLQQQQPQARVGSGSGVIISDDGYIITNNHVVADADELTVVLTDNRSYTAKVIGTDPTTDLALIKIDEEELPFIKFANSESVKVGQWVAAIGNPFRGLNSTVTAGIVSATGRSIGILRNEEGTSIESFIQTDAAVNPGNSGGALVNLDGDLIGINSAIFSPTGAYAGYAFAIPTNIASKVVSDLKEFGTVQRGFLGINIQEVNADLAKEYGLSSSQGVYVANLVEEGSAAAAGIEEGDVIVQIDDHKINKTSELLSYIGRKRPGDEVEVTVVRDGERMNFTMELKALESNTTIASSARVEALEDLGADFQALTKDEATALKVDGGVKVVRTFAGKFRQQGIRPGFVITGIAGKPVRSLEGLTEIVENEKGGVLVEGIYPDKPNDKQYYGMPL